MNTITITMAAVKRFGLSYYQVLVNGVVQNERMSYEFAATDYVKLCNKYNVKPVILLFK